MTDRINCKKYYRIKIFLKFSIFWKYAYRIELAESCSKMVLHLFHVNFKPSYINLKKIYQGKYKIN